MMLALGETKFEESNFIAWDLETTSLFDGAGGIVEMAAVQFDGRGQELAHYQALVNPGCSITAEASSVHGITEADVRDQPTIGELLPEFVRFLDNGATLLAHNAPFDVGFLTMALSRCNLPIPDLAVVDTLPIARALRPQASNYQLGTLARELGVSVTREHRALADSIVLKQVFLELIHQSTHPFSLPDLLNLGRPRLTEAGTCNIDPPAGFEKLGAAIESGQIVEMVYTGGSQGRQPRLVTPVTIYQKKEVGYLVAICHKDERQKNFRLDRIHEFRLTGQGGGGGDRHDA